MDPLTDPPEGPEAAAWSRLNAALRTTEPECDGMPLFTADRRSEEERALLASICESCPVLEACHVFAVAANVKHGYWGGEERTRK